MNKTIKTENILAAWRIISSAKYNKMDDDDKIKIWKISRILLPIATKFEEDSKDVAEKMKPSDDFVDKLQKAQNYERILSSGGSDLPMTTEEYNNFIIEYQNYNKPINTAIKEMADKEVEIEIEQISEDAFGKLMSSNDWTIELATIVSSIIL